MTSIAGRANDIPVVSRDQNVRHSFGKPAALSQAWPSAQQVIGPIGGVANGCRNFIQGSCAGLLTLAGATQFAAGAPASFDITVFSDASLVLEQLIKGDFMGLPQILGGAALFFFGRRRVMRVLGLLAFIVFAAAYFNGVEISDVQVNAEEITRRLQLALQVLVVGEA